MRVAVECSWERAGAVELVDGQLRMPVLPEEPGIYQWVLRHVLATVGELVNDKGYGVLREDPILQ